MLHQDSTHETGVSDNRQRNVNSGNAIAKARNRKAQGAIQLRLGHATWDEIATIQGYPTAAAAKRAVEAALVKELKSSGDKEQMRRMAGARLDQLLRSVWAKAVDPEHPEQMTALTKARELIAQHAKLFGLDAPTEVVVHNPTTVQIEQWVAAITAGQTPQVEEYDVLEGVEQEDGSYAVSSAG
jgi:hypothetical protein